LKSELLRGNMRVSKSDNRHAFSAKMVQIHEMLSTHHSNSYDSVLQNTTSHGFSILILQHYLTRFFCFYQNLVFRVIQHISSIHYPTKSSMSLHIFLPLDFLFLNFILYFVSLLDIINYNTTFLILIRSQISILKNRFQVDDIVKVFFFY